MQNPMPQRPYIGFGEAIQICLNKYADFKGRASRAEYWWFILFMFIVGCFRGILNRFGMVGQIISGLVGLAFIVPQLAVCWRRMHDIGKGGGWWFICFIPVVGWILWIVWCCQPSEQYPNRFGDVPA